jgi:hypothetical protein
VRPEPAVTPREPALAFVSRLVEDYADEWLWRPAMHYRWSYPETARLMSAWLSEHAREQLAPGWLKRRYWRRSVATACRERDRRAAAHGAPAIASRRQLVAGILKNVDLPFARNHHMEHV